MPARRDGPAPHFPSEVAGFFDGLAKHNSRECFTAHRDDHDRLVRDPLEALLAKAQPRYGSGRVMRPNRDVRFSTDKSPYRVSGAMWAGQVGGVYVQVDAGGVDTGGGLYEPTRDQLARAREAIGTDPRAARSLSEAVETLQRNGFEMAGPSLSTAPRGYPKDHPAIELLRLKHDAAVRRLPLEVDLGGIEATWSAVEPLIDWSSRWVGPALCWP